MSAVVALIVGLGNPGPQYHETRHNAGFWFVDKIARQQGEPFRLENKFQGELSRVTIEGKQVWLLKPSTFMNRSGQSIAAVARFYKIPLNNILVVHDELDLPPGVVRLKQGGGHGGHNGLRDTISQMGGNDFLRLRVGIGHPGSGRDVSDYVLNRASRDQQMAIEQGLDDALSVLPLLLKGDLQKAMQQLHTD